MMRRCRTSIIAIVLCAGAVLFAQPVPKAEISGQVDVVKQSAKDAKTVAQKREVAFAALKLANDAVAVEEYSAAKELSVMAVTLIRPSKDRLAIQRAVAYQTRMGDLLKQWNAVEDAHNTLATDADNPAANETVGRYLCLIRNDWNAGLPYLAKGSDPDLRAAADADLKTKGDTKSQEFTAIAWWNAVAGKKKDRVQFLSRCAHWYEQCAAGLTGLPQATAEKRILESREAVCGRPFSKILSGPANAVQSHGTIDCQIEATLTPIRKTFNMRQSWMLSLQFNTRNLDPASHMIFAWGDGRNGRDPIVISLNGAELRCNVDDCEGEQRQTIIHPVDPGIIGKWVDVKFIHDSSSQTLELFVDHCLIQREPLEIVPNVDRDMVVCLGGIEGNNQRYTGLVRRVWLGNIK